MTTRFGQETINRFGGSWTDEECGEYRRLLQHQEDARHTLWDCYHDLDQFLKDHPPYDDDPRPDDHL